MSQAVTTESTTSAASAGPPSAGDRRAWPVDTFAFGLAVAGYMLVVWAGPFSLVVFARGYWPLDSMSKLLAVGAWSGVGLLVATAVGSLLLWFARGVARKRRPYLILAGTGLILLALTLVALIVPSARNVAVVPFLGVSALMSLLFAVGAFINCVERT